MAILNLRQKMLGMLRGFPALFAFARWCYRAAMALPVEVLRRAAPRGAVRIGPPKGIFSAVGALRRGEVEGRLLLPGQEVPAAGPDSMRVQCRMGQNGFQPWPVFFSRHRSARLVGSSLVLLDKEKRACEEAMYGLMGGYKRNPSFCYAVLPKPVHLEGPWMSLVSQIGHNFYHWIHEELPRLAMLTEMPAATRILIPATPARFIQESLELLGLTERVRPAPETHLLVEDFYFVAPSAMYGCPNPYALRFLRSRFLPLVTGGDAVKIFLTRSNTTRGLRNNEEVEAFFAARGWKLVDLDRVTLLEQIGIFARAVAIAGVHGGAFTHLVWCAPGCKVLEIFANSFLNGCYEGIAACLKLDYRYLIFPGDGEHRASVDMARLAEAVDGI